MSNTQSKVLVLESCDESRNTIKSFCDQHNLMTVIPKTDDPLATLKSFVDLGAIFISETFQHDHRQGLDIAAEIHHIRPELPIFFRCTAETISLFQNIFRNRGICSAYQISDIDDLQVDLKANIFNQEYPNILLRGIEEVAQVSLGSLFDSANIEYSAPYLVKDRIIYGELLSLIPIESNWCKGFMMFQSEQKELLPFIDPKKITSIHKDDFRTINDILSELTNMVWGGIKARFIGSHCDTSVSQTQIPIIINHANQYISFGSNTPQLCFQYTLRQAHDPELTATIYQKFIFNINWAPDQLQDEQTNADSFVSSGELEFF